MGAEDGSGPSRRPADSSHLPEKFRESAALWWARAVGAVELLGNARQNVARRWFPTRPHEDVATCLNGQVCIVTGANAGVGLATCRALASQGAHVIMACRSLHRGLIAVEEVKAQRPLPGCHEATVEIAELDLNSLASVRRFVQRFEERRLGLRLLVCNAAIMGGPRRVTEDGFEMQFQGNYLGHWMLATELLAAQQRRRAEQRHSPPRRRGPARWSPEREQPRHEATRVLFTSSLTHRGGRLDFGDLQAERQYDPLGQYAATKLASVVAAKEMQRRFHRDGSDDTAVVVDPGTLNTNLAREYLLSELHLLPGFLRPPVRPLWKAAIPWLLLPAEDAAENNMYAATATAREVAGKLTKNKRPCRAARAADDEQLGEKLWEASDQLVKSWSRTHAVKLQMRVEEKLFAGSTAGADKV